MILHRFVTPILTVALLASVARSEPEPRIAIEQALTGAWAGALEYQDYSPPRRRVALPTTLMVARDKDRTALILHFVYDDGPGKLVTEVERFALDGEGRHIEWGAVSDTIRQVYTVRESRPGDGGRGRRMMLEIQGSDDDAPATIRETVSVTERELRILKEVRPAASGAGARFGFRHEYVLRR